MPGPRDTLMAAIDRWAAAGLLDAALEAELRADTVASTARDRMRWSQFILATTGAVVSITAGGVFLGWAWPAMGEGARSGTLMGVAIVLILLGVRLESRDRWAPAAYLLQTAGLGMLLGAGLYSAEAWPNAGPGGVAIGLVLLIVPLFSAWKSIRRNPVMPAIHVAAGYAFLALFLSRTFNLSVDEIIWILDGVLLVSVLSLVRWIRAGEPGHFSEWALYAFAASLYAGLVLIFLTAAVPLDMDDGSVLALDLWWGVVVILTLWGIHRAPPTLQRGWYETQLGWNLGFGIILAFATSSVLDLPDPATAGLVGAFGIFWLWYGVPRRSRPVVVMACLAMVAAAWFLGVQEAGALGVVLALGFTAALLFWVSSRIGDKEP